MCRVAVALAVTWRLLRDHLDKNRACSGLVALILIPLYDIKAADAQRQYGDDSVLGGGAAVLSAGSPRRLGASTHFSPARSRASRCSASTGRSFCSPAWRCPLIGPGTRRFWRSPAPYADGGGRGDRHRAARLVVGRRRAGASALIRRESVINHTSFGAALAQLGVLFSRRAGLYRVAADFSRRAAAEPAALPKSSGPPTKTAAGMLYCGAAGAAGSGQSRDAVAADRRTGLFRTGRCSRSCSTARAKSSSTNARWPRAGLVGLAR